jgi:PAS domain S-box-containing protein
MQKSPFFDRYQQLQGYVRWSPQDQACVPKIAEIVQPHFGDLIDDFYQVIQNHPDAARVITGGEAQIARLKKSLRVWLEQLLAGCYDEPYVARRSAVGRRHVEIGLSQVYTNVAMSRLRSGMIGILREKWKDGDAELFDHLLTLDKLLDLELAIIEDAYETEHVQRQKEAERSRMKSALHREKEFSQGLLEQARAIVLVLDVHGCIVRFNPYMEELTGISLEEVRGKDWFREFVPDVDQDRLREVFQKTVHNQGGGEIINSIICRSGRERRISWSNKTLKTLNGRTTAVLAVGHDITDLNHAQQRALQAERLAAIGQMITGLAHESRNALQRIQACAEMLELEVEGNQEAMDLVGRIKLAQDHMHRLYDEVRGYAAPITLDRVECRLGSIWREAWELLSTQRENRVTHLVEKTTGTNLTYVGDHFRLVQVFRILLENSLAACADPVNIEIAACPTLLASRRAIRIAVRDNGPGLNQEQRERIFEPFYTTKTKGTGLGMAIAQRIVEAHDGKIAVGADRGGGTEILVTLTHPNQESV